LNSFTGSIRGEINGIEAFTASFSSSAAGRITTLENTTISLPTGLVSSSQQITNFGFISSSSGVAVQGTISSSQQITNFGFISSSAALGTKANYHIISQSIIATDPIDSNLLLSSVYIDKSKTITFLQFSQSLDSRLTIGGGGAENDYIQNITFANNTMTFTGVGRSTFSGDVKLANGIVSGSQQIVNLGFPLTSQINETYIRTVLPTGVISGSSQLSNLGYLNNSSGVVSSSAQIVLLNSISGGFDTSHVAENENYQYYTTTKVQNVLNGLSLVSGSVLPSGSVSSSSQIDYQLIYNKPLFYTGSSNVFITSGSQAGALAYGSPWVKIEVLSPTITQFNSLSNIVYTSGLISGSTQISSLGFLQNANLLPLNDWTGSGGGFSVVSQSINQRINNLILDGGGSTTLADLTDVNISDYFPGQLLTYNDGAGYWQNTSQLDGDYVITGSLLVTGSMTVDEYTALTYVKTPTIQSDTTLDITAGGSITITPNAGTNVTIEDVLVLNKVIGDSPTLPPTGSLMNSGSINSDSKLWFFNGTTWKEVAFV
jgi:hypothetical protein